MIVYKKLTLAIHDLFLGQDKNCGCAPLRKFIEFFCSVFNYNSIEGLMDCEVILKQAVGELAEMKPEDLEKLVQEVLVEYSGLKSTNNLHFVGGVSEFINLEDLRDEA